MSTNKAEQVLNALTGIPACPACLYYKYVAMKRMDGTEDHRGVWYECRCGVIKLVRHDQV